MSKKVNSLFFGVLALSGISCAYADAVCNYTPGLITCGAGTVPSIHGNGLVRLNGTIVTDSIIVNGKLIADNATLNKATVSGQTNLENTKILNAATLNGSLYATSSTFSGTLTMGTSNSTLDNTTTKDIVITPNNPPVQQKLNVQNHSTVDGSITFQQSTGNGLVYLSNDSTITGSVIGGKVVQ